MLFIGCADNRNNFPENLGIERLVPYLNKRGFSSEYDYLFQDMEAVQLSKKLNHDLIGFSLYADTIEFEIQCIKIAHRNGAKIIVGSKYATDNYREILNRIPEVDAVCLGHGEEPIFQLLMQLKDGVPYETALANNPYMATRQKNQTIRPCVSNITQLELPDRNKYMQYTHVKELFVCDSHGCTGACTFCSNCQNMKRYSTRTPEDICRELFDLNKRYGITQFNLTGNSFEDPDKRGKHKIEQVCDILQSNHDDLSIGCYIKGNFIQSDYDKQLLEKMVQTGFTHLFVGVESGNLEDLELYGKRATLNECNELLTYMKSFASKIFTSFGFIMLNPFSTRSRLRENFLFLRQQRSFVIEHYTSILYIYPATKMHSLCKESGLLLNTFDSLHPLDYTFQNDEIQPIVQFIMNTIRPFQESLGSTYDTVRNIYGIRRLLHNKDSIDVAFFQILDQIADELAYYFELLYHENDITRAKEEFTVWSKKVIQLHKKLKALSIRYKMAFVVQNSLLNSAVID